MIIPVVILNSNDKSEVKHNHNGRRNSLGIGAVIAAIFLFIGIVLPPVLICAEDDKKHHVGEYFCPHCHSRETKGFNTFWYNDGMLCNGSDEYILQHADFTLMSCENCGSCFKLYRKDWE